MEEHDHRSPYQGNDKARWVWLSQGGIRLSRKCWPFANLVNIGYLDEFWYALTLWSSHTLDLLGVGAYIVDDGSLEVGHLKVPPFTDDIVADTRDFVELKGTVTRLDYRRLAHKELTRCKPRQLFWRDTYRSRWRISRETRPWSPYRSGRKRQPFVVCSSSASKVSAIWFK